MTQTFDFIVPGATFHREATQAAASAALQSFNSWRYGGHEPVWPTDARYDVEVAGYFPAGAHADADGLLDAVCLWMTGVVYGDPRQVGSRIVEHLVDPKYPRVEVTVTVSEGA